MTAGIAERCPGVQVTAAASSHGPTGNGELTFALLSNPDVLAEGTPA